MTYSEYDRWIRRLVADSTEAARRRFALETIRCLHAETELQIDEDLCDEEVSALKEILDSLNDDDVSSVKEGLRLLDQSLCKDEIRAEEIHPPITQLLCAVDHWLNYRMTRYGDCIAEIAINMVNAIDYRIGGDFGDYSIENMEGDTFMREEFVRQRRILSEH